MLPESHPRKNRVWPGPVLRLAAALLLACVGLSGRAAAQAPPCPTTISGFPPALPPPPEKPPRPPSGKESVGDFVEGLSNIDSAFEVILGQSRILTTKEDLAATGKAAALIAIGDPAVIDFTVLSARQLRVIGRRIGVTDLSVTTSDRRTY
ncbi:MAG TPA: pilus assembly protein N-terminal domain-containing protein, partial [Gemmataceae bacterium]|nr:pilus assembly protein N-terminal domain-containing protein [Gemmataceae bacterium]